MPSGSAFPGFCSGGSAPPSPAGPSWARRHPPAPPAALPAAAPRFAGVGLGIVAAGTLIPQLLGAGLVTTWLALGLLSLGLTLLVWTSWPTDAPLVRSRAAGRAAPTTPILAVGLVYALFALGLVPHMVFLVDFIARGLGWGIATGSLYWVLYGLGAVVGPFAAGWLGDRIGFARGLALALTLLLAGVLIPLVAPFALPLALSALVTGAFTPGMPTLVLGRMGELSRGGDAHAAWAFATTAYAVSQAGGAYAMSWLYAHTTGYEPLFLAGAAALAAALALSLIASRAAAGRT